MAPELASLSEEELRAGTVQSQQGAPQPTRKRPREAEAPVISGDIKFEEGSNAAANALELGQKVELGTASAEAMGPRHDITLSKKEHHDSQVEAPHHPLVRQYVAGA